MKKLLLLSKYGDWEENSFHRFYQYIPDFQSKNVEVIELPLFSQKIESDYIHRGKASPLDHFLSYFKRFYYLSKNKRDIVVWLDSELFPYIPFDWENLLLPIETPIILDIYNSFFYKYTHGINFIGKKILQKKIPFWISRSDEILVSSHSIYRYCQQWRNDVHLLPLALDEKNIPSPFSNPVERKEFVLGWTGTPFTSRFLKLIADPLRDLARYFPLKLKIIGAETALPIKTETFRWKWEEEMEILGSIDIGLNPLPATLRELGNPGLKTIKYMSHGKPVIASPYGGSENYILHSENGFHAKSVDDWHIALRLLLEDASIRKEMGAKSKSLFINHFTKDATFKKMFSIFSRYL